MDISDSQSGLTLAQRTLKRSFDIAFSGAGLLATAPLILVAYLAAAIDTRASGFFRQQRVGRGGQLFEVVKIRTMRQIEGVETSVTADDDPRITQLGRFLRKTKIDELPQLINVLKGEMSMVGPRPDVAGFADCLQGRDRLILSVRPGITGPATLHFRNEEELLSKQENREAYNREVIYAEKVRINCDYVENYRFSNDLRYIIQTLWR